MDNNVNIVLLGDLAKLEIAQQYVFGKETQLPGDESLVFEKDVSIGSDTVRIKLMCEENSKANEDINGYILVYSVNSKGSFESACSLTDSLREDCKCLLLLGVVSEGQREVSIQAAQSKALEKFSSHAEVSKEKIEEIETSLNKFIERTYLNNVPSISKSLPIFKTKAPPLRVQPRSSSLLSLFSRKKLNSSQEADTWTSLKEEPKVWSSVEQNSQGSLIDFAGRSMGYQFQVDGPRQLKMEDIKLEFHEKHTQFYNMLYYGKDHYNFVGNSDKVGNVLVSFESTNKLAGNRVLVRTKKGDSRVLVPPGVKSPKAVLRQVKNSVTELDDVKLKQINNTPSVDDLFSDFENKEKISHYKFGVLYVKEGQNNEDEIYSNRETSQDFEDFLGILGDKIELLGYPGNPEGLDTKYGTTGRHSVATKFEGLEIMYHVATMLPYQEYDEQKVERKRHLGNDVVLIIFKEGNLPFDPQIIHSHFNHVFIVVQVHSKNENGTQYRVAVATKGGVEAFGPTLPPGGIFENNELFRKFLLTKIINGERASMNGGEFRSTIIRTRNQMLSELTEKVNKKRPASGNFLGVPLLSALKLEKEERRKSTPNM